MKDEVQERMVIDCFVSKRTCTLVTVPHPGPFKRCNSFHLWCSSCWLPHDRFHDHIQAWQKDSGGPQAPSQLTCQVCKKRASLSPSTYPFLVLRTPLEKHKKDAGRRDNLTVINEGNIHPSTRTENICTSKASPHCLLPIRTSVTKLILQTVFTWVVSESASGTHIMFISMSSMIGYAILLHPLF